MTDIDELWADFGGDSLAEFHDAWKAAFKVDEPWDSLSDQDKLSFALEVIDSYLTDSDKVVVREAWARVYEATAHIYPAIPQAVEHEEKPCGPSCRLTTWSSYCECQGWCL